MKIFLFTITLLAAHANATPINTKNDLRTMQEEYRSFKEDCQADPNSKWIGGRCYFFHEKLQTFDAAQDYCQVIISWLRNFQT